MRETRSHFNPPNSGIGSLNCNAIWIQVELVARLVFNPSSDLWSRIQETEFFGFKTPRFGLNGLIF
jgi:hypothetical protein